MNTRNTINHSRGQSLMEIVFALAIFTIGVVTIGYLMFDSLVVIGRTNEYATARFLAREGIETIQSMGNARYDELPLGSHGLVFEEGGGWSFSSTSSTHGAYERTITITEVETDTKEIESRVSWSDNGGISRDVRFRTRISNWMQRGGAREFLMPRIEYASLSASSTELTGVELSNDGEVPLTISSMVLTWSGPARLSGIVIEGEEVFSASSTPAGSGDVLDTVDYTLNAYSGFRTIDSFTFTESIASEALHSTFILSDGSERYLSLEL